MGSAKTIGNMTQASNSSETRMPEASHAAEPIAIVGMACRFPGAGDLNAFWQFLLEGKNAVTEGDPASGEGRMGEIFRGLDVQNQACRFGAFVDDIDLFDAEFFRISPVEAEMLDPQQRMMLEASWLALEDAGIDPSGLKGSRTGVYTGISNDEYRMLVVDSTKPGEAAGSLYALSGTNLNGTSGRVSFVLGLMGPAKAVDAACASAMVAVNDAVADLQHGKADLAIAGGVQAILNGRIYELRAESMMLSPEGQCKTFDASADGYVRGEGCGVVVLKRLSEAEADGDRIWAVIRSSAVNHGGASVGLTVPHTPALEQVMETALADARVLPAQVDYLEAHGTGTAVGDPIEIDAVANVYGRDRDPNHPLLVGSVKTNVGHLESAAGIAGVIKAALVVNTGVIPKHLHFRDPNPSLDWERLPLQITSDMMDWPQDRQRPRLAGVNSFGISGTNAHIVVEEYAGANGAPGRELRTDGAAQTVAVSLPEPVAASVPRQEECAQRQARFLPLSAKSEDALRELSKLYAAWLEERSAELTSDGNGAEDLLADMAWTAGVGRSHFDHRAGAIFHDTASLKERLDTLAEAGTEKSSPPSQVAFVYTGQGSQWVGMGKALYESEPVARAVLDRCEAAFQEARGESLLDVMFGLPGASGDLGDTAWEQPSLYALESALTALWASVGVRPSVVLGHSVGEIAAAQAAGVFSLEDGMRFAARRGSLLSSTEAGTMAAVFAPAEQVENAIKGINAAFDGIGLSLAADNGAHTVVSGPVARIDTLVKHFDSEGVRVRRLNTTRAFHSPLVEPALDGLEAALDDVAIGSPNLTVISNLSGSAVTPDMSLDGAYWRRHAREPVAFASGVRALAECNVDFVIEIGPHAVLGPMATLAWPDPSASRDSAGTPVVVSSLRRPPRDGSSPDPESSFMDAVAAAYETGLEISFAGLFAGEARRRISLPGYPFQRERHWLERSKHRRASAGHPLLGQRHDSARGETTFETEIFPSDPAWLQDHRVFGRLVVPGALYGAMAAATAPVDGSGSIAIEEMQLHSPLVFPDRDENGTEEEGRQVQILLDAPEETASRHVQVFSKGSEDAWTLHVECRVSPGASPSDTGAPIDLNALRDKLSPDDESAYYRAKAATGINLGPFFRTLGTVWSGPGEALAEVSLPNGVDRLDLNVHPLVLDGCFQVVGVARNMTGAPGEATYLPFGWERLWLSDGLPDRVFCHVRMSEASRDAESEGGDSPEVLSGEVSIYDPDGTLIGEISGYTVKRATQAALLAAIAGEEGVDDLLYEVVWRERALGSGILPADFYPSPTEIAADTQLFTGYLTDAGVDPQGRNALLADLERWSRSRALATLEELGWRRVKGTVVDPEELRQELDVLPEHARLFRRLLEMLARSGVLEETSDGFVVVVGPDDPLPVEMPSDIEAFADWMSGQYPQGQIEIGLFLRSGLALAEVLRGREDPLTLLFSSGEPTAADLYLKAPVARAANRMLADAVQALVAALPTGRRLRIIEVGAGTGSATASVLPELPAGQFEYMYTDISAGFFAEAEARFGDGGGCIEYRPLDIERDPIEQGFTAHGYDLLIASNVLHATRYLKETLGHCRDLLAPSGQLIALENLSGLGWMDLTFGQLDGWWRFADDYRPHHALASPAIWRQALGEAGFTEAEVLGPDEADESITPDKGVIVAQGPAQITETPGVWVLSADHGGVAEELAAHLAERNQTVVLASNGEPGSGAATSANSGVRRTSVDLTSRESWRALIEDLPQDAPFNGVVHLAGLDGCGAEATTAEIGDDVKRAAASALALVQGVVDSDAIPANGIWFVTRGAQVLERERAGQLAGATLWGLGKVVYLEAPQLRPRMIDMDPAAASPLFAFANEFLYPDRENHIAYRSGRRVAARLARPHDAAERLSLPEESAWVLVPNKAGVFDEPEVKVLPARTLQPREVLVAVEATGLNFWDVFRSLGFIEEGDLGRELCGRILDIGSDVSTLSVGDHVVGLGFGAFGSEMVTHEELVTQAPDEISVSALATVPSAFVSAALSYKYSGLEPGDRVLIHAGAGGVGLAAIQLAQAAGATVYATASAPKQAYLRSVGVEHVFDSRTTAFGEEILAATGGEGVHVVLNSLTSEGFIEASLDCLAQGGRFVELARRDILSHEEMAAVRPDVKYDILELDVLKKTEPAWVGEVLREVMDGIGSGDLTPLIHSRWPLAEAGAALGFMRSARHIGKIVLTPPPLLQGQLREDRTYLVTGGLGGIGCAVAEWLAACGAGVIVLNGRRPPDAEAEAAIAALRESGVRIEVELADVTDATAIDAMLARMDATLPSLGGVIHSVGVLADAALTNQTWASFEQVLWPKILGAWHLHRATLERDLDLFVLFSSRVGVMGNPGQANHAAANAFLDQLAGHRRALGLPGQAIAWGAWSEIGEAAEQRERIEQRRAALGGRWFTPQQGIKALELLVRQDTTTSVVMSMDWSVFAEAVDDRPPFLEDLLSSAVDEEAVGAAPSEDFLTRLRSAPAVEQEDVLAAFLQQEVQAVLRLTATPALTVEFSDLGMDSLMAVELRNRINRGFAGEYVASNTVVFDYPSISGLARHLAGEIGGANGLTGADEPAALPEQPVQEQRPQAAIEQDGIAIIGMACRIPGAEDLDGFWRLMQTERNMVTDGRQDAGSWNGIAGDPESEDAAMRHGAFLEGIDLFDSRFFRIAPIEARMMDPQQRLLLETSWQALEDAGINPDTLRGSRTGVFAGVGGSEYRNVISASGRDDDFLGTSGGVTVGRIAFALGLEGPAVPLELACAASLVAVHQAATSLQRGEIDMALAGGVNAALSQSVLQFLADAGMLSLSGQCRTFDAAADGYVRGEGCGMVILKRLSDAEADGDRIWGVVRGSAVNQNGAGLGLTLPNGPAQERAMEEALAQAGIAPAEVDYFEAHGPGTALGDTVELNAAANVYGRGREAENPLLIGSVKTNIGHLEAAGGVASLIKTVLAMNQGMIPKHLNFNAPNPDIDWARLPLRVTSEAMDWPRTAEQPLRASVNVFGISGANAHVVVEGYSAPEDDSAALPNGRWPTGASREVPASLPEDDADSPVAEVRSERSAKLLPLSGKTRQALRQLAERYLSWLDGYAEVLNSAGPAAASLLSDMAWTASVGRSHFPHRAALAFQDFENLREQLARLAETDEDLEDSEPLAASTVAFAFTGQGSHWVGLGRALYEQEPVARAVLDRCEAAFMEEQDSSLLDVMFGRSDKAEESVDQLYAAPAVYALQCALTALWESVGVQPSVVTGQDLGAVAAAQAAGAFSLEDGLRLAAAHGASMSTSLTADDRGSASERLASVLADIELTPLRVQLVDGVTGNVVKRGETPQSTFWDLQADSTKSLEYGIRTLAGETAELVIEIGPQTRLNPVQNAQPPGGSERRSDSGVSDVIESQSRNASEDSSAVSDCGFLQAVAGVYDAGYPVALAGLFAGEFRRRISLPSYPFQRRRHWIAAPKQRAAG